MGFMKAPSMPAVTQTEAPAVSVQENKQQAEDAYDSRKRRKFGLQKTIDRKRGLLGTAVNGESTLG